MNKSQYSSTTVLLLRYCCVTGTVLFLRYYCSTSSVLLYYFAGTPVLHYYSTADRVVATALEIEFVCRHSEIAFGLKSNKASKTSTFLLENSSFFSKSVLRAPSPSSPRCWLEHFILIRNMDGCFP